MEEVTNNQLFEYMTMMYGELVEIKNELSDFKNSSNAFHIRTDESLKSILSAMQLTKMK